MTRLRALLLALAASFAVLLLGVTPRAEALIQNATLDSPADQGTYGTPRLPLAGTFTVEQGKRQINVVVKRQDPDDANTPSNTFLVGDEKFDGSGKFSGFMDAQEFKDYNGTYSVDATFTNDDPRNQVFGGCGNMPCTQRFHRTALLIVPPAPPSVVVSYKESDRKITVTWDEPTVKDMIGWIVVRFVDGKEGETTTITADKPRVLVDDKLPDAGGRVEYAVTAGRRGATNGTSVRSETVTKGANVKPQPPDAPTTTVPAGGTTTTMSPFGKIVTAPPSTVAGGKPKGPGNGNVGDFAKGLNGAAGKPTRSTLADGTYEDTLPYGSPGDDTEPGADEAEVFKPVTTPGETSSMPAVFFVAAASLASVIAAHVLYILRQVKKGEPNLADVPLEEPLVALPAPIVIPAPLPPRRVPRKVR